LPPPEKDWDIGSPVMLSHQRHPRGNALIRTYMERDFRAPKDFASFLYVGQVLQGIIIKYAAEAHRRRMGHNWGSLYWQLDDCWPVASWSGIDYYGRWKALHYYARHFFAPVLVSPVEDKGGTVTMWGISDRRADTPAKLSVRLLGFDGHQIWRGDQDIVLAANASRAYATFRRAELLAGADPKRAVLVAELNERATGKRLSRNLFFFEKTKDLDLPKPELSLEVEPREGGTFAVKVTAQRLARAVYLTSPDRDAFFDENYFDLLPGESVTVTYRPSAPTTAKALRAGLHAVTIADSY
jgi:beta-mannosidase